MVIFFVHSAGFYICLVAYSEKKYSYIFWAINVSNARSAFAYLASCWHHFVKSGGNRLELFRSDCRITDLINARCIRWWWRCLDKYWHIIYDVQQQQQQQATSSIAGVGTRPETVCICCVLGLCVTGQPTHHMEKYTYIYIYVSFNPKDIWVVWLTCICMACVHFSNTFWQIIIMMVGINPAKSLD